MIDGDGVTIGVGDSSPGSGSGSGSGSSGGGSGSGGGGGAPVNPYPPHPLGPDYYTGSDGFPLCRPDRPLCRDAIVEIENPVTIEDVRHFPVAPGRAAMQPDGWTIAGLPTNFYAVAPVQQLSGELLGEIAEVRFTPIAYRWNYGDGSTASLGTAGTTWAALGQAEFTRTPTSHVYRAVGSYTIRLSIVFRADYRYAGGDWAPVRGTLTLPANELRITAGTADTVLVARDCLVDPAGPGC